MYRKELVSALSAYPLGCTTPHYKGQVTLARFLHWWFENKVENDHWYEGILVHLNDYLDDAMECFRESSDVRVVKFRDQYLQETEEEEFPDLKDVSAGLQRQLIITKLAQIMAEVSDWKGVKAEIEGYFHAEDYVLAQTLMKFNRKVWRRGMWRVIQENPHSGTSGMFGKTELGTFYTAGRVMMTFARPSIKDMENSVSFVAGYDDQSGVSTGVQSVYAPLQLATEMIMDVVDNWPSDIKNQNILFQTDNSISII